MMKRIHIIYKKITHKIELKAGMIWQYVPVEKLCDYKLGSIPPKLFILSRIKEIVGDIASINLLCIDSEIKNKILVSANDTMHHNFDYLGSGKKHIDPISWRTDFKFGFTWDNDFYKNIRKKTKNGADIKVPWELSRGHHLLWLGEAYLLSSDEKYAEEVINQISEWIDDNPLMYSVNWTCSMEVAIRAVNWMYAIAMISESQFLSDQIIRKIYRSLYQHAFFIRYNLEKSIPWNNNHYVSDIVGLLFLGEFFKEKKHCRRWLKFAIHEFYKEILIQILPSGVHYEKSISYHRLMFELNAYSIAMLKRTGHEIPQSVLYRINKMYDYIDSYIKPNGYAPLLADSDNGRFLPFVQRDFRDHKYVLDKNSIENIIINCSINSINSDYSTKGYQIFEDAGVAILQNKDVYLLISNIDYSKIVPESQMFIGTHTHNDSLSFELAIGDEDIIIDPGTYVYTSDSKMRNAFRSTSKHNTIMVDNEEQNFLPKDKVFLMKRNCTNRKLALSNNICTGSYSTLLGKMKHHRMFTINPNQILIEDNVSKFGSHHEVKSFLHLAEGLNPKLYSRDIVLLETKKNIVKIKFHFTTEISIVDDIVSPSYGILKPSQTIIASYKFNNECINTFEIEWKKK